MYSVRFCWEKFFYRSKMIRPESSFLCFWQLQYKKWYEHQRTPETDHGGRRFEFLDCNKAARNSSITVLNAKCSGFDWYFSIKLESVKASKSCSLVLSFRYHLLYFIYIEAAAKSPSYMRYVHILSNKGSSRKERWKPRKSAIMVNQSVYHGKISVIEVVCKL